MKWKNKLKVALAETANGEKFALSLEKAVPKGDKTLATIVSSPFGTAEIEHLPKISPQSDNVPKCSNCDLELEIWKGELFCAMGCPKPTQTK